MTSMTAEKIPFPLKYVVAPMVDQSDIAFRILCRRHGAHVAYTEMLFSEQIVSDAEYREKHFRICAEDRPLVVQLCGNNPEIMVQAGMYAQDFCDAVDINLGCPQKRAQEGHYGSYLLERKDWNLVFDMVASMKSQLAVPIFCKIRLLPTLAMTLEFCKGLELAGCSLLAVHGRLRGSQVKRRSGPADLNSIRAIKQALNIPVISNGNVRQSSDIDINLEITKADGVMSAEGILRDPLLFHGGALCQKDKFDAAMEYLNLCKEFNTPMDCIRQHLSYMLGKQRSGNSIWYMYPGSYKKHLDLKNDIDSCTTIQDFEIIVDKSLGILCSKNQIQDQEETAARKLEDLRYLGE